MFLAQQSLSIFKRDRYNSTNPYSAAKAGGEELAIAFESPWIAYCYYALYECLRRKAASEKYIPTFMEIKNNKKITIPSY